VHMLECARVRMLECARARMHECARVRMLECARVRMLECARVRMHKCARVRMHECARVRMHECARVRMHECARVRMHEFARVHTHECVCTCMHKEISAQVCSRAVLGATSVCRGCCPACGQPITCPLRSCRQAAPFQHDTMLAIASWLASQPALMNKYLMSSLAISIPYMDS
jgi:hypothetical protein